MTPLTLERARAIVEHAENEFGSDRRIEDAFTAFAEGGASTRLEALHALYVCIADYFRLASARKLGSPNLMKQFDDYANASRSIAMRIMYDNVCDPEMPRTASGFEKQESVTSFVGYLRTLDPAKADFWPQVYQRLGLDYPIEPNQPPNTDKVPSTKKAWWRFW